MNLQTLDITTKYGDNRLRKPPKIEDVKPPSTPAVRVWQLRQRINQLRRKRYIPVQDATAIKKPARPLSAYMIDPKYLPSHSKTPSSNKRKHRAATPKAAAAAESADDATPSHRPNAVKIYQYSRLGPPAAAGQATGGVASLVAALSLAPLRRRIAHAMKQPKATTTHTYETAKLPVKATAVRSREQLALLLTAVGGRFRALRSRVVPVRYSVTRGMTYGGVASGKNWLKVGIPVGVLALLFASGALLGPLSQEPATPGQPISQESRSGNGSSATEAESASLESPSSASSEAAANNSGSRASAGHSPAASHESADSSSSASGNAPTSVAPSGTSQAQRPVGGMGGGTAPEQADTGSTTSPSSQTPQPSTGLPANPLQPITDTAQGVLPLVQDLTSGLLKPQQ